MSRGPTSGHTAYFRNAGDDGRIHSGLVDRNAPPVIAALSPLLANTSGNALEIGSGTGQHILRFATAFPDLKWHPSDPDPIHRQSIDAWRRAEPAGTSAALDIDASLNWWEDPILRPLAPLHLILSLNVIHISPAITAENILNGAARLLSQGGLVAFYGPFMENGVHTGEGNAKFDRRLRFDNPDWGLRDIANLSKTATDFGLKHHTTVRMPANNRLLTFQKP